MSKIARHGTKFVRAFPARRRKARADKARQNLLYIGAGNINFVSEARASRTRDSLLTSKCSLTGQ